MMVTLPVGLIFVHKILTVYDSVIYQIRPNKRLKSM